MQLMGLKYRGSLCCIPACAYSALCSIMATNFLSFLRNTGTADAAGNGPDTMDIEKGHSIDENEPVWSVFACAYSES